jgi:hypothetical protein
MMQYSANAHLKAFSDAIELDRLPRMGTSNFNTSVVRFSVTSGPLVSDLMSLEIVPRKSTCLKPWNGPPDLMRPYWRGLFDGDGCITSGSNGKGRRYWSVSMNGTEDIVRGLVAASLVPCAIRPHASIWRSVWMGTAQPRSILGYLYENSYVHLPRKFALYERVCRELHPVD